MDRCSVSWDQSFIIRSMFFCLDYEKRRSLFDVVHSLQLLVATEKLLPSESSPKNATLCERVNVWKGERVKGWTCERVNVWKSLVRPKLCFARSIRNEFQPLLLVCQQTRHRLRNYEQICFLGLLSTPNSIRRLPASRCLGQLRVCWVGNSGQTTRCDPPIKWQGGGLKILTVNCHHHVAQHDKQCTYEVLTRHLFCRGKVTSIKYSECVSVALGIQQAWRMGRITVTCCLPGSTIFLHTTL
jgi:hypothetical protein